MKKPKLRSVEKYHPPYLLNKFPATFPLELGREIVYHLASRSDPRLEGQDWEEIFARLVGAKHVPSNVGLDDIVLGQCAWGAKSVKATKPSKARQVRLISGRNSPAFSFGDDKVKGRDPNELGEKVLSIWNERVASVRKKFQHLRTIVLVKSSDLLELVLFEFETVMFHPDDYKWKWNKNNNLEGFQTIDRKEAHKFTWQPHGSQFTIIEEVPPDRLAIRVKGPPKLDRKRVLEVLKFDRTWVEVLP